MSEEKTPAPGLIPERIREALRAAVAALGAPEEFDPQVTPTADARFGDYQSNTAMVLAKVMKRNPRELAAALVGSVEVAGLCEPPEIAGPGFLNFRVTGEAYAARLAALLADPRLGVPAVAEPKTIVIDFSAPNVAKPMHVGHIRSTIIGDSLARVARFLGHRVITDNHIGDWGTQFGMIIHGWKSELDATALEADPIHELLRVYKSVNARAKADAAVMEACKDELVKLQAGDAENLAIWKRAVDLSLAGLGGMYARLDVRFDHFNGESFYNARLAPLVDDLIEKGIARESEGAVCVFSDGSVPPEEDPFLSQRDGEWGANPCIVRKADGGFLYSTSDLATIDFRLSEWKADEIWYVVGAPQQLHFRQIFAVSRMRGIEAAMTHIPHGSILGEDRKLMKTRSGENVQLADVLTEAVERARAVLEEKNPTLEASEKVAIAEVVGIGAVKYAELSQHRMTDYVFSWEKMLALQGNTAPYLQYAYVRTRSIFRKLEDAVVFADDEVFVIAEPAERTMVAKLCQFGEVVPDILNDHKPNILTNYLYELATTFHSFFEACPVLRSEGVTRRTRLALCEATSRVLRQGLDLLGIRVTERM